MMTIIQIHNKNIYPRYTLSSINSISCLVGVSGLRGGRANSEWQALFPFRYIFCSGSDLSKPDSFFWLFSFSLFQIIPGSSESLGRPRCTSPIKVRKSLVWRCSSIFSWRRSDSSKVFFRFRKADWASSALFLLQSGHLEGTCCLTVAACFSVAITFFKWILFTSSSGAVQLMASISEASASDLSCSFLCLLLFFPLEVALWCIRFTLTVQKVCRACICSSDTGVISVWGWVSGWYPPELVPFPLRWLILFWLNLFSESSDCLSWHSKGAVGSPLSGLPPDTWGEGSRPPGELNEHEVCTSSEKDSKVSWERSSMALMSVWANSRGSSGSPASRRLAITRHQTRLLICFALVKVGSGTGQAWAREHRTLWDSAAQPGSQILFRAAGDAFSLPWQRRSGMRTGPGAALLPSPGPTAQTPPPLVSLGLLCAFSLVSAGVFSTKSNNPWKRVQTPFPRGSKKSTYVSPTGKGSLRLTWESSPPQNKNDLNY